MSFVHLHVHTQYSLLDGFSHINKLIQRTKDFGMPAIAISDHGTMFGVVDFFREAQKANIKPIIGVEMYISERRMQDRDPKLDKKAYHVLLLAENQTGYENLLQIASAAQLEGFYYKPRVDHEYLEAHAEGLIVTSACLQGEIPQAILKNNEEILHQKLNWYINTFGKDNFFLELQRHEIDELKIVNKRIIELSKEYNLPLVATNDTHYVDKEDAYLQDIQLAISTGSLLSNPDRFRMNNDSYYLRSPEEMKDLFKEVPEAIENTLRIAERCNVDLTPKGYHLPLFPVPEKHTAETYLRELCESGLKKKYGDRAGEKEIIERLNYELGIIHEMGFDAYFLIVWDLCQYAQKEKIWYNTRGSASGSIVAYTLEITSIDPLHHKLIFERFLNPGRVSMPDIDLDFQDDKRTRVMEYCAEKYGSDKVAQIITFGTQGAKAAIRDVGRVKDIPLSEVDRVAKLIPARPGVTIDATIENEPEFAAIYNEESYLTDLIDTARGMEGTIRSVGTHAAGVVVTDKPITAYGPLHRPTSNSDDNPIKSVVQYEMNVVDYMGLLKVDFLGLTTLTIMQRTCDFIKERYGKEYNLTNIPVDDPESYEMLSSGNTAGVFQFEGTGMTRYIMQMKPTRLEHLVAMAALYRPGPLAFIPSYIKRMHGEEEITYRHDRLAETFGDTYGIPIYQEQLMATVMNLAGYTAPESDNFRKAIAKKKQKDIELHRNKFIEGAAKNDIPKETAEKIFEDWEGFARYGFPKGHAANYAHLAVQTAYLKAHYPVEYMTALLSCYKSNTDKVAFYIADCKSLNIEVKAPDINNSEWDFTIESQPGESPIIRFGMGAIKNVGMDPVELIIEGRKEGKYKDLNDFIKRIDLQHVGKRALESLIRVGALDVLGKRTALINAIERMISISSSHFKAARSGQLSIFGADSGIEENIELDFAADLDPRELLEWEKELLGLYVSDHPLTPYLPTIKHKVTHFSGQLQETVNNQRVKIAGMIQRFRPHQTKKGKMMGFVTLEDIQGMMDLVLFPKIWNQYRELIEVDQIVLVTGKIDNMTGEPKVLVDSVKLLEIDETIQDDETAPINNNGHIPELEDQDIITEQYPASENRQTDPDQFNQNSNGQNGSNGKNGNNGHHIAKKTNSLPDPIDDDMPPPPEMPDDWFGIAPSSNQPPENSIKEQSPVFAVNTNTDISMQANSAVKTVHQLDEPQIPADKLPENILPIEYMVSPRSKPVEADEDERKMITVIFRSSEKKERDKRRMHRAHGILHGCPGNDQFAFLVYEQGNYFLMEFPNNSTKASPELLSKLGNLVGSENIRIEALN